MGQYKRLFLIADPAMRHSPALQRAVALAEASGAALHIAAFVEPFATLSLLDKDTQKRVRENQLREHREWLADEAGLMRSKGIAVTTEVMWTHHSLKEILLHLTEMQPDLLIKDVQHEPVLKRVFVTPLDWHLLRESPVPVHLVGHLLHPLPRKVIAAVDTSWQEARSSGLNERIIQAANGFALQCDAELHLVHAYDLSSAYLADTRAGGASILVGEMREAKEEAFVALAESHGVPMERRHFMMGTPISVLADIVRHSQVDVIVMGTAQRRGLNTLIGSTTEHVLYQVPCSVLAVRD